MIGKSCKISSFFKALVVIVNIVLFLLSMNDIWSKFDSKITTTAIRFRSDEDESKKTLPCFTFCAMPAFRTIGFPYKEEDFIQNTYDKEDFFTNDTLDLLQNSTLYSLTETWSFYLGRCHTICFLLSVGLDTQTFYLKQSWDMKLFIHSRGEEFWLLFGDFPTEKTYLELNTNNPDNITKMLIGLTTKETTVLTKDYSVCTSYPNADSFVDSSRQFILQNMKSKMNCSIAMTKQLFDDQSYPKCLDESASLKTYDELRKVTLNMVANVRPLPCTGITYIIEKEYYHLRSSLDARKVNNSNRYLLKCIMVAFVQ